MRSELEAHKRDKAASEIKLKEATERLRGILGALEAAVELPKGVVSMLMDAAAASDSSGGAFSNDAAAPRVEGGGWPAAFGAFQQVRFLPAAVQSSVCPPHPRNPHAIRPAPPRPASPRQNLSARLRHIHDQSAASIYHARVVPMEAALAGMASELKAAQAEARELQEQVGRGRPATLQARRIISLVDAEEICSPCSRA